MIKYFQKKFAFSEDGARDFKDSVIWNSLLNLSYILPWLFGLAFINDYVIGVLVQGVDAQYALWHYIVAAVVIFSIIWLIAYRTYDKGYTRIYKESAKTRINLAETLRQLPLSFFGKKDLADLTSTVMDDTTQFEQIFSHTMPQLYSSIISGIVFLIGLFIYDWQMALAMAWVIPVALLVYFSASALVTKLHLGELHSKLAVNDKIQEGLDKAQEIKSYNQEQNYLDELNAKLDFLEKSKFKSNFIGIFMNLANFILRLGLPSVIVFGAYKLANGDISLFKFLVFMLITDRVYVPFLEVVANSAVMAYLDVRIDRVKQIQQMPRQTGRSEFNPKNFDIEFKAVDFSYQAGEQTIHNASFVAKQGEVTALIGPSGGGKSTLAKLAARFWDIDKGEILLGGENIAEIEPETLLKQFSIVFQDVQLFNASVMDNIRLGRENATDEEVKQVAKLAQCEEFIANLAEGYDTLIGENGEKLSGGERQRISIARALLKDAQIILLDEATASLDAENETKIQKAISALIKDKTVLIIAHRMRTVAGADKIVAIKNGEIVEQGSAEQLQAQDGIFAKMLKLQSQGA